MTSAATLLQMATNTTYPSTTGISVGLHSANTTCDEICLMRWSLQIAGTPGSSPTYQVLVKEPLGNWVNTGTALTATGGATGLAFGSAVRLSANNGTSPGTGSNTPRYRLDVMKLNNVASGR